MPEDSTPPQPTPPQPTAPQPTAPQPTAPEKSAGPDTTATAAVPVVPDTGYTPDGVPTFDGVREKIEHRYGTALGATELAEETREVRTATQELDARQRAAEEKLAEIRASMHKPD